MHVNSPEAKTYLLELYQMTGGDLSAQVSMFEVGSAIGMPKEASGKIAEDLIGEGWVEVKTLSGGIGITAEGIEVIQAAGHAGTSAAAGFALGDGPVLEKTGQDAVAAITKEIKDHLGRSSTAYPQIEEMVIDLKTIEVQLLSPRPKTAIVREVLGSLRGTLESTGQSNLSDKIGRMIAT